LRGFVCVCSWSFCGPNLREKDKKEKTETPEKTEKLFSVNSATFRLRTKRQRVKDNTRQK
jgi:hypothetical protein